MPAAKGNDAFSEEDIRNVRSQARSWRPTLDQVCNLCTVIVIIIVGFVREWLLCSSFQEAVLAQYQTAALLPILAASFAVPHIRYYSERKSIFLDWGGRLNTPVEGWRPSAVLTSLIAVVSFVGLSVWVVWANWGAC